MTPDGAAISYSEMGDFSTCCRKCSSFQYRLCDGEKEAILFSRVDTCANEAVPWRGMGGLINHRYLHDAKFFWSLASLAVCFMLDLVTFSVPEVIHHLTVSRGCATRSLNPSQLEDNSNFQIPPSGDSVRVCEWLFPARRRCLPISGISRTRSKDHSFAKGTLLSWLRCHMWSM